MGSDEVPQHLIEAADSAATAAAVAVTEARDNATLRQACNLLASVWGRSADGVPVSAEVLRSIVHADGAVTVARATTPGSAELVGAAVLIMAGDAETYSLIAAARPGGSDRGIGFALKQRQRVWALARGRTTMRWTFDPLMARNARFNIVKLGARVLEYVPGFYGEMDDEINAGETGDRVIARWQLDAEDRPAARSDRANPPEPDQTAGDVLAQGPDGLPAYLLGEGHGWCRVPTDILALRRSEPTTARLWREMTQANLLDAFSRGYAARSFTRSGWYYLVCEGAR